MQPIPVSSLILLGLLSIPSLVRADWRTEANARIERIRKGDFTVRLVTPTGQACSNTVVTIRQTRNAFGFGTCIAGDPTSTNRNEVLYRRFILDHFNMLVCENSMKWYAIEPAQGERSYADADQYLEFAEKHRLSMRGHCLLWSKAKYNQSWVKALAPHELRVAVERHVEGIVKRYAGRLVAWDVYNESLDDNFFEQQLGDNIAVDFYRWARRFDPKTPLFTNEYNILDNDARTTKYIELVQRLLRLGAPVGGIGIQEHAAERITGKKSPPDPDYPERAYLEPFDPPSMLRRLDRIAQLGLPIHITEVSACTRDPQQRADGLEMFLRTAYSHPAVEAILLWGFWERRHWLGDRAALVDAEWNLTPAGKRFQHLILREWRTHLTGTTDATGCVRFRGFYGEYDINGVGPVSLTATQTSAVITVR